MNRNGLLITLAATAFSAGCVAYTGSKVAPLAGSLAGKDPAAASSGAGGSAAAQSGGAALAGTSAPGSDSLAEPAVVGTAVGPSDRPGHGTLTLTIRWPARSVQAIPASTKVIRIEVWNGASILQEDGTDVAVEVTRPDGQATSSVSLDVPEGGPYEVRVKAYKDLGARTDAYLVAQGTTSATVLANEASDLQVTLTPTGGAPSITRVIPSTGGPGAAFEIVGTGFGSLGDMAPTVTIGGVPAQVLFVYYGAAGQESTVSAQVSRACGTGPLVLTYDSVPAGQAPTFTVLQGLAITNAVSTLAVGSTRTFTVQGVASPSGDVVSAPAVRWYTIPLTGDYPAASIDGTTGELSADEAGTVHVYAESGDLQASFSLTVN